MYKKILVPTDGSEISRNASTHALKLAKAVGASVHAVFVIDTRTFPGAHPLVPESMAPHYFSILEEMRKAGEGALQELSEEARKLGVAIQTEVIEGMPAPCILDTLKKTGMDLVVMGTHGRSGFAALLLGSTAQAVIHGAKCPVLLVR